MPGPTCCTAIAAAGKWSWLPFIFIGQTGKPQLNSARVFESLIQAAVVAAIVMYGDQRVSTQRIEELKAQVGELQTEVRQMRADLYRPLIR